MPKHLGTNRQFSEQELINLIGHTMNKVKATAPAYGLQMLVGYIQMPDGKNVIQQYRLVPDKSIGVPIDEASLARAAAILRDTLDPIFTVTIQKGEQAIQVTWLHNLTD